MLCRRCGLESSTTDICEWCNRPMLPAGATVSGKAAKELKKSGQPVAMPSKPAVEPEVGLPLHQQQGEEPEAGVEAESVTEEPAAEVVLRPLGHGAAGDKAATAPPPSTQAAGRPGVPSHGLSTEATATSVDISQYVGKDQSIFRPIQKEAGYSSAASLERVTQKKSAQAQGGPEWSENERLIRCAISGMIVCVVVALVQYFVGHSIPDKIVAIPLGRGGTGVFQAIKFGIASGLMFGFMLGALLVRLQKGPFIGMLAGLLLGFGIQNGVWGYLAGAVSGILVGRFATLGVRRVINV
jgi:hypothetical protein